MKNSVGKVEVSYDKRLNFAATSILLIWIFIIIFGIFSSFNIVLLFDMLISWTPFTNSLIFSIVSIIGFFPSRSFSISLIDLFKNKRWIKPSKFIKSILIQLLIASIASTLIIILDKAFNFTEFFSLFTSFAFLFSIEFLVLCFYYFRAYDFPKEEISKNRVRRQF